MSEDGSSKSIDDIFASVSRLGRKVRATAPPSDLPLGKVKAESLVEPSASMFAPPAQTAGRGSDTAAGDAVDSPVDDPLWQGGADLEPAHSIPSGVHGPAPTAERAIGQDPARLEALTEEEIWAAEQAAAQLALLARHRADAEKRAQQAEEERRAAEQAAPLARERALTKKRARLVAATEEGRRAAMLAEAQASQAKSEPDDPQPSEGARDDRVAQSVHPAAEQATASAEASEHVAGVDQARAAAAAKAERRSAEQAVAPEASGLERAWRKDQARFGAGAEEEGRQAAASDAPIGQLHLSAADSAPATALPAPLASPHTGATPWKAQTTEAEPDPAPGFGRGRALAVVAIAAVLVVAAGAVAAFMSRGSGEVGPASGGASSGAASERSGQTLRFPPTEPSTLCARLSASAVSPLPPDAVTTVLKPSDKIGQWARRQVNVGPSDAVFPGLQRLPGRGWLASVQALAVWSGATVIRDDGVGAKDGRCEPTAWHADPRIDLGFSR